MIPKLFIYIIGIFFIGFMLGFISSLNQPVKETQLTPSPDSSSIGFYTGLFFGSEFSSAVKDRELIRKRCKGKCDDQERYCRSKCFSWPVPGGPAVEDPQCAMRCVGWGMGCRNGCDIYANNLPGINDGAS
jgi:hypothetical protein